MYFFNKGVEHKRGTNDSPQFRPLGSFLIIACLQPHPFQPFFKGVHKRALTKHKWLTLFSTSTVAWVGLAYPQLYRRFLKIWMEGVVHKRKDYLPKQSTNDLYHFHPPNSYEQSWGHAVNELFGAKISWNLVKRVSNNVCFSRKITDLNY